MLGVCRFFIFYIVSDLLSFCNIGNISLSLFDSVNLDEGTKGSSTGANK